jgi:hypothetical protein
MPISLLEYRSPNKFYGRIVIYYRDCIPQTQILMRLQLAHHRLDTAHFRKSLQQSPQENYDSSLHHSNRYGQEQTEAHNQEGKFHG